MSKVLSKVTCDSSSVLLLLVFTGKTPKISDGMGSEFLVFYPADHFSLSTNVSDSKPADHTIGGAIKGGTKGNVLNKQKQWLYYDYYLPVTVLNLLNQC